MALDSEGFTHPKGQMIDFNKAIDTFSPSNKELTLCHCAVEANRVDANMIKSASLSRSLRFGVGPRRPRSVYDCTVIFRFLAEQQCHNPSVTINFSHCHLGDKMITVLAEILASKLGKSQVHDLYLGNNNLPNKSVEDLFHRASSAFQYLSTLSLESNQITAKGISAFALHSMNIASLDLSQNPLEVPGMQMLEAVIVAGKLAKLERLDLQDCLTENANSNGELLACLTKALVAHCHNLSSLDLSKNNVGIPGAEALGKTMSKISCKVSHFSLYVNDAMLGDEGVNAFVNNIEGACCFGVVELKNNNIHSVGASFLTEGVYSQKFQKFSELVLDDNPLGLNGTLAIGRMLSSGRCKFKSLSLSNCCLASAEGMANDCQALDVVVTVIDVER